MRKLASIQTIQGLSPIHDADVIEQARVLGWSLVVKKCEFRAGDRAVFFEIDSVLPEIPIFEFMRSKKFRVKTVRMRGCLSQGLALPVAVFPQLTELVLDVGSDVTELLGVTKFEVPESSSTSGIAAGPFPSLVPKTDEMRIQSVTDLLHELRGVPCYATVKLDGTSATFAHHEGETWVCGRNIAFKESESNAMWKIERKIGITEKLKALGSYAVQGEICGPKIQGNPLKLSGPSFFAFNVYDIKKGQILGFGEMVRILAELGVEMVPIERVDWVLDGETVESLLQTAEGKYASGNPREGLVIRPMIPQYSTTLNGRASFKVISNQYLLRNEK